MHSARVAAAIVAAACFAIPAAAPAQDRGGADVELLDFGAEWCGPCRSMESVVAQLISAGYPVRKVNVDQNRDLARKFQVTSIPAFVLTKHGREIDRIEGVASVAELIGLFYKARATSTPAPPARNASPESAPALIATDARSAANSGGAAAPASPSPGKYRPAGPGFGPAGPSQSSATSPDALALSASVRLAIEDANGFSYGSGTIVDARAGEALVLTCGHIFRDSKGGGRIAVDVFGANPQSKLVGHVISYDLKRDVGLVSIRPHGAVAVAPIASPGYALRVGDRVISVGCDNGANPSVRESRVTALNKFLGPANVEASGQPTQGRSGGGLFSADGHVVGVCNAADPADNEGLYAAAETIHAQLDQAGLAALYRGGANNPAAIAATQRGAAAPAMPAQMPRSPLAALAARDSGAGGTASAAPATNAVLPGSAGADVLRDLSPQERATLGVLAQKSQSAEVICIVRSLSDPRAKSEIIVLDRASPTFLKLLSAEDSAQAARHLTSLRRPAAQSPPTAPGANESPSASDRSGGWGSPSSAGAAAWQPSWR